ncbi:MAG: hypothetical protein IPJ08_07815 [Burkholderiales bacterium]|nr:hypothetical protein [Burkholderiales bacterium]
MTVPSLRQPTRLSNQASASAVDVHAAGLTVWLDPEVPPDPAVPPV